MVKISAQYKVRCMLLKRCFIRLGRGSRAKCSWDIKVAPATISRILNGKYKSWTTLEKMEAWMDEQEKSLAV